MSNACRMHSAEASRSIPTVPLSVDSGMAEDLKLEPAMTATAGVTMGRGVMAKLDPGNISNPGKLVPTPGSELKHCWPERE